MILRWWLVLWCSESEQGPLKMVVWLWCSVVWEESNGTKREEFGRQVSS